MSGIFISYRREDSDDATRAIYESLRPRVGKDRLFMDVEAIAPGSDFRQAIEGHLSNCSVFLAVIGPTWLNAKPDNDPNGPRRLDNPSDFVRQEVATALKKGEQLPVIPVLVRGATMPSADQLPDDLQALAFRNALTLNQDDWDANVDKLLDSIRSHVGELRAEDAPVTPAAAPVVSPASGRSKALVLGLAALVALAAVLYFAFGRASGEKLTVTLKQNPRLSGLPGPINVSIDDQPVGEIHAEANGSTPLQFQVTAGQHTFKFTDSQSQNSCTGTFAVSASETKFIPRMRAGVTACAIDSALNGS